MGPRPGSVFFFIPKGFFQIGAIKSHQVNHPKNESVKENKKSFHLNWMVQKNSDHGLFAELANGQEMVYNATGRVPPL